MRVIHHLVGHYVIEDAASWTDDEMILDRGAGSDGSKAVDLCTTFERRHIQGFLKCKKTGILLRGWVHNHSAASGFSKPEPVGTRRAGSQYEGDNAQHDHHRQPGEHDRRLQTQPVHHALPVQTLIQFNNHDALPALICLLADCPSRIDQIVDHFTVNLEDDFIGI